MPLQQGSKTDKVDNDSGIRSGRPGSHLSRAKPHLPGLAPGVLSPDDLVDVDASVRAAQLWRKPCRATGTQRQRRGEKTSLGFKTTNTRTYLGAPSFTHSDVEYNVNKVSTVVQDGGFGKKNSRSDFESVRFNRILPARPRQKGGDF